MTTSAAGAPATSKPLLRGVLHEASAFVAAVAGAILFFRASGARARAGALVYGLSLVTLLAVSATYHRKNWSEKVRAVWRRLDHSAIFLLIAGTYTPLSFLLGSRLGWIFLGIVWGGAVLGIVMSVAWVKAPKALVAAVCVLLGWAAIPLLPALKAALGTSSVALLAAGGVVYSLGAAVYALRRPDPFPRVFGYHEIFHALVVAAAVCHFAVVARAVVALSA
ncbi:MAG TPA: hemolysin III family protein [Thermoanaerobaculia bacterium]|nr:hemolysin III family protein [Thermoanaerobaculia bacterium]